jgi:putative ABC transport system permease protein
MINPAIFKLALRNATRKPVRTTLTAGMVVAGTALLVIAVSWMDGIFDDMLDAGTNAMGHVRVLDPDFEEREELRPMYENLPDADVLTKAVAAVPGVVAAYPVISTGVTVTVGEEIGDVFGLLMGAPNGFFEDRMKLGDSLKVGRLLGDAPDELVLGSKVVERSGAKLGDEVVLLGMTQDGSLSPIKGTLVGIVSSGNPMTDMGIFAPLERVQWLTDIPGGAIEILAYGEHRDDATAIAAAVSDLPATQALSVQAWSTRAPWAQMLPTITGMRYIIAFMVVFLAGLGVWNTMMMSVLERTDEVGVLRAMGMSRSSTLMLFIGEAVVIAAIGGVLGVLLGAGPSLYLEAVGFNMGEDVVSKLSSDFPISTTVYADFNSGVVLLGILTGLISAVVGSALPALRAALIQPVTAMRSGR